MAIEQEGTEPPLVLIGYSKGATDILEAIVIYPEIRARIAAVISVAGAIGGSPVADQVSQKKLELLEQWPGAECSEGDGGALESMRPATRQAWLAENPLPQRNCPIIRWPHARSPDEISPILKARYKKLRESILETTA